ncbi:hypothetical protein [Phenylobacterium kunshanense]|uniref:Uncharacterized protein n=1 Tax=Phenylobacterium kunshanense TaxID=1445034 RepID=A0A328B5T9_9CAUL|nr:hypothetical protein [Phenylobacterium kunshanense]RAK61945.1 hypothetical protein DJ019_20515 [Phenylobacterium kunshanense]
MQPTTLQVTRPDDGLPADLAAQIDAEIYACEQIATHPTQYHYELQYRLRDLGARLGYISKLEFWTPSILAGKRGQIDVVWTCRDGGRGVAFELDASWRRKSIVKLLHMAPTHYPVWIVYGDPYMTFGPEEFALDQLIVIQPDLSRLPPFCRARVGRERLEAYRREQRALKAARRQAAAAQRKAVEAGEPSSTSAARKEEGRV